MKLVTKAMEAKMPALYSTEEVPTKDKKVFAKFFTPDSSFTWFAVEGEIRGDDILFFGLVDSGGDKELGYFTLSQLLEVRGPLGLRVERDINFDNKTLKDIL